MKLTSFRHLLLFLAAPAALWAQPSCDDCDCQCDAGCCAPPPMRDTGVAVAVDEREGDVAELQRLIRHYVEDPRLREQILAEVAKGAKAAVRDEGVRVTAVVAGDAVIYAAMGRQ